MPITKEVLTKRLAEAVQQRNANLQNAQTATENAAACNGAIQVLQQLIGAVEAEEAEAKKVDTAATAE